MPDKRYCIKGRTFDEDACEFEVCENLMSNCIQADDDENFFTETNPKPCFCCSREHQKLEVFTDGGVIFPLALPECGESYEKRWR